MKFAIIADIHANLEAFQTVLADIKEQKCTHYACVGDVVGYGANPKECLKIVRDMGMPCVKGNHDEYCSMDEQLDGFNAHAAEAVNWTRKQLNDDERQWLKDLKYFRLVTSFSMVHATLDGPQRWGYVFDKLAAAASFTYQNTAVCFFGHTHVPVAFIRDTMVRGGTYSKFKVDPTKKYFVNVGSVGQPRDNNPKAAYVVYDVDEGVIELRRLEYDIAAAQKKILDAGLPPRLAERLSYGRESFFGGSGFPGWPGPGR
jgi:predicted phosphodiesterase